MKYTLECTGPRHPQGLIQSADSAGAALTFIRNLPQLDLTRVLVRDEDGREVTPTELVAAKAKEDAEARRRLRAR